MRYLFGAGADPFQQFFDRLPVLAVDGRSQGFDRVHTVLWVAVRKSGFDSLEYEDPHEDPVWRVVGGPWRVLQDGPRLIPVFRKRRGKPELNRQQVARMAAYCHLMEVAEQALSPYAVVLFDDGYEGSDAAPAASNRFARRRTQVGCPFGRSARWSAEQSKAARRRLAANATDSYNGTMLRIPVLRRNHDHGQP